jgi:hypothetical protein
MHTHSEGLIEVLEGKKRLSSSINFNKLSTYTSQENGKDFSGQLTISNLPKGLGVTPLRDENYLHLESNFTQFPISFINVVSIDGVITPEIKINLATEHPYFNFHLGFGTNKKIKQSNSSLITMPFSFLHKNANCVHNGIMLAVFDGKNISNAIFQISSETCAYYKFDYIALYETKFERVNTTKQVFDDSLLNEDKKEPIETLYKKNKIKSKVFADGKSFAPENVTLFGLIDDDVHYTSACETRKGIYPLCDQMLLPSYSLAKSLAGTFGIALIENEYEMISDIAVEDLVKECKGKKWRDVTVEDLSDMATGNFLSSIFDIDEAGLKQLNFIFDAPTDAKKTKLACNAYPRKSKPGTRFVYHTSDTYILGKALNGYLEKNTEIDDYYSDLLIPFFKDLKLSYAPSFTLKTEGDVKQPYTGWGMYLLQDDLMQLSKFIHAQMKDKTKSFQFLKQALLQKKDTLVAIPGANIFYNNGFWLRKYEKGTFGCKRETWVPFMSGFGGITVAFLPNNMTYYYFSDGYTFAWDSAVFAANEIKSFCTTN